MIALLSLLLACGDADPSPGPLEPPGSDDTGAEAAGSIEVACAASPDNALRYECHVTVDPPGPVQIAYADTQGGPKRVHRSDEVATRHVIPLYLMAPRRDYTFTAFGGEDGALTATGELHTEAMPTDARVTFDISGAATFDHALVLSPCLEGPYAMIIGTRGEVLWYHRMPSAPVQAASFTEDGTVLVIAGGDVIEVDLLGNVLLHLRAGVDLPEPVHHDVFRKNGYTWVLFHEEVKWLDAQYLLDGVYVFDPRGRRVATWRLFDHLQPPQAPGPFFDPDYSHANSVWVDDEGDFYVSMRHLSAVVKVAGQLESERFGTILWRLTGDPGAQDLRSDFTLQAPPDVAPDFLYQHNAHLLPDGRLTLFDNRRLPGDPSRVLTIHLDEAAGIATIDEAYTLPQHCPFQGSAWHTTDGNPVATCSPVRKAFEFDRGDPDRPRWSMQMQCFQALGVYIPRVIPIDGL